MDVGKVDRIALEPKSGDRAVAYGIPGENIDGMDVVDDIRFVETGAQDAPLEPVIIQSVEVTTVPPG